MKIRVRRKAKQTMKVATWNIVDKDHTLADELVRGPLFLIDNERRMHLRAYNYWQARLGGRAMPKLSDCADLAEMPFASNMALIDLGKSDQDTRISRIGAALEAGVAPQQRATRELFAELLSRLPVVVAQCAPVAFEADMPVIASADAAYCYRGILLPLSDETGALAHVLAVMNWRGVNDEDRAQDKLTAFIDSEEAPAEPSLRPGQERPSAGSHRWQSGRR